jgi:centractin
MDTDPLFTQAKPIVIDNGSSIIKAGFGGCEKPEIEMHTLIGRPKHSKVMMT